MVYVVTMFRYGNHLSHSYTIGVFSSIEKANAAGENETTHRGGKYIHEVIRYKVDKFKCGGSKGKRIN